MAAVSQEKRSVGVPVFVIGAVVLLGLIVWGYVRYSEALARRRPDALTAEAKAYTQHLRLSEVSMKANRSYLNQMVVEIEGRIANNGDRPLATVEIYCVFYDAYGQVVLRKRLPIVGDRLGGLKPAEAKSFRLPFDELPESWNQQMPQLVIAAIRFG